MPLPSANLERPSGGGGTREAGKEALSRKAWQSAAARASMVLHVLDCRTMYLLGEEAPNSARAEGRSIVDGQGSAEPCARESKARTGRFLKKSLSQITVCFHPTRLNKERQTDKILEAFFRDAQGFGWLHAGSRAGFTRSRPPRPLTSVLYYNFHPILSTCPFHTNNSIMGVGKERRTLIGPW